MTGNEALALHLAAQELLRRQIAALTGNDLDLAETLGLEVGHLLGRLPDQLDGVDEAMRVQLLDVAHVTARELASSVTALDHLRRRRVDLNARAERDDAAMRRYLPPPSAEPARFLDERR